MYETLQIVKKQVIPNEKFVKKKLKKTSKVNLPAKLNRMDKRPKCLNLLGIIKL